VGVPIQKDNEAPLGPEAKWEENGEEVFSPYPTWLGVSSPSGFRGGAPGENCFIIS